MMDLYNLDLRINTVSVGYSELLCEVFKSKNPVYMSLLLKEVVLP